MVPPTEHPEGTLEVPRRPATPPDDWPTFHLAHPGPGRGWPGDPNCAFFWKGTYHLHYIYDPGGEEGADPFVRFYESAVEYSFAHVSSTDLVHWTWRPTTLNSDVLDHGMFSGTGFITKEGRPAIIYQGHGSGANQVAVAEDDELERWSAPVAAAVHVRPDQDGSVIAHTADPDAWREGDTYYAIFGSAMEKSATLLTSTDLTNWDYLGPLLDPDLPDAADDTDVSCPNFFPIGNKHMLLCISHNKGCRYYLGEWKDEKFTPEFHGRMNWHATDFFAPESVLTPDGRRVMWAWVYLEAPQSGIQSLPRELELPDDGILRIRPLRELETLRADERHEHGIVVDAAGSRLVTGIAGDALELDVTIRPGSASRFGIRVHCDAEGGGGVPVAVDTVAGTLSIGEVEAPFELGHDEDLRLRVFIDKYLVEAFANDRQAMLLSHPSDPADTHVAVFSENGDVAADVTGWRIESIYSTADEP